MRLAKESPLQHLERRHRAALSGAVVAKAYYLAQVGEPFSTPATLERARLRWKCIEARRQELAAQLSEFHHPGHPGPVPIGDLFANIPVPEGPEIRYSR